MSWCLCGYLFLFEAADETHSAARAGQNDLPGFAKLFRGHLALCAAAVLGYASVILVLDDWLMHVFTHGRVAIVEPFFALIVAGVASEMVWTTLFTPISAVNRHRLVTYIYFTLSIGGIVICYPLVQHFGIVGAGVFVLGVNAFISPVNLALGRPSRLLHGHAERLQVAYGGA